MVKGHELTVDAMLSVAETRRQVCMYLETDKRGGVVNIVIAAHGELAMRLMHHLVDVPLVQWDTELGP